MNSIVRIAVCAAILCFSLECYAQTDKEKAFMRAIEDTLVCNCSSCGGFMPKDSSSEKSISGSLVLFNQEKQVAMRGCFSQWKLICGIECIYDESHRLISVKAYRNGQMISETKMQEP